MQIVKNVFLFSLLAIGVAACSGSSKSANSASSQATTAAAPAQSTAASGTAAASGAGVYGTNCSSCHQAGGVGLPGSFPPLAANPVVTGDPKTVIHIVKYGLSGKIQVAGKTYNGMMPAWSPQLSNGDIASVITYVRSSWGNKAGAVTVSAVSAVSK